ncbi:hypothetical protein ACQGR0_05140 [Bacillus sp. GMa5/2]
MTPNDILLKNSDLIVKSLFQRADRTYKQFLKYSNTSYNAEVGTSRYWKAVAGTERTQREIAYVTSFEGKEGSLTDNCEWIFVAGKVSQSGQNNS